MLGKYCTSAHILSPERIVVFAYVHVYVRIGVRVHIHVYVCGMGIIPQELAFFETGCFIEIQTSQ